jgi:subtilisin family serine protease
VKKFSVLVLILSLIVALVPQMAVDAAPSRSFIVVFESETLPENASSIISEAGGSVTYEVPQIGVLEATTDSPTEFIKAMVNHSQVKSLAPSFELPLNLPEVDLDSVDLTSSLGQVPAGESIWESGWQWDIEKVTHNGASHGISSGSKDVVVGVIDTGFDFNHPDLKNNIVSGSKTFVPGTTNAWDAHSHGTHVAGTIGANGRVKGIAPNVGLRAYRVFNTGGARQIWITNAMTAAADDRVDVINMSLGGTRVLGQWFYTDPNTGERILLGNDAADWVAYQRAVQYAVNRNVTVVVSAGNDRLDLSNPHETAKWYNQVLQKNGFTEYEVVGAAFKVPSQTPGVVTVSATGGGFGTADRLAFYSNYGNGAIELGAPGGDLGPKFPSVIEKDYYKYLILSTVPTYLKQSSLATYMFGEAGYGWKGGTSMAAPQVSGAAAAYISHVYQTTGVKPTPKQVQTHLQQTAQDAGKVGYDELYGHGIVDAYKALGGKKK